MKIPAQAGASADEEARATLVSRVVLQHTHIQQHIRYVLDRYMLVNHLLLSMQRETYFRGE
jgi:hypothetical protein